LDNFNKDTMMWDGDHSEGDELGDWVKNRLEKLKWERLYTTSLITKEKKMFAEDMCHDDVDQGVIGDCWFMSACSSMGDHPERVK